MVAGAAGGRARHPRAVAHPQERRGGGCGASGDRWWTQDRVWMAPTDPGIDQNVRGTGGRFVDTLLDKSQTSFKADEITYLDRKAIKLDRMLLNLFELLRYDGRRALRRRRRPVDVDNLVEAMRLTTDRFPGFADHPEIAKAWLTNDLLEIMNRGKPGRETVVGPRPFHLNAFKLANPKAVDDYGAASQVWAMLFYADRPLLTRCLE